MVAATTLGPLTTKSLPALHILPQHTSFRNGVPSLPPLPLRRSLRVRAASVDGEKENKPSSSEGRNLVTAVLEVPLTIWRRMSNPLSNFGFGQRSIWEGGVGLFIASGTVLLALTLVWLRGFQLRSRFRKYQVIFEFSQACGISLGTPARIRGVTVGTVIRVHSSLEGVNALVEVEDDKIVIPRNSLVEVNQSGLLMETMIDITPRDPLPTPSVSPLSEGCLKEGLIVCDREKIRGEQGVSLDALVGIFTRLGREMEEIGVAKSFSLAEKVASVVQEAQPLLVKIEAMAEDVQPLLSEIRGSALLKDIQSLTKTLAQATEDLRAARSSIASPENAVLLRQSMVTLIDTLKNIEGITSDISVFTGDKVTRQNLKLLIRSLSRLL